MPMRTPDRLYNGYIFDLDGTIYLGDALLPDAADVVSTLREHGAAIVFVSNNPTFTRQELAAKLSGLGIPARSDQIVNSTHVLIRYLRKRAPGSTVFPIGEPVLRDELRAAGFQVGEDSEAIDFVIASFDRTLVYHKLQVGFDALRAGARFIATNADPYCPVPGGGQPDAGAVIAALEASSGRQVEEVVGKPSPIMARTALEALGVEAHDCLLTGDRLQVDIVMAKSAGMSSALVLTGATTAEQVDGSGVAPDFVVERLSQILP